jgi:phenylpyruvate tautomerase
MPILKIQSNQLPENREAFMQETTGLLSELLNKPTGYIMIILEEADMLFAGNSTPCLYAELKSIGLPGERTAAFSKALCTYFGTHTGIPGDRIYIEFTDTERHLLGWNGKTFQK